ncbi:hypothetical protein PspLS_11988 [Pyricularia sp. CBS 133598]|nr:hypothetical protein PspLS_11988 [Pyricularia sp. CBS 133598]
MDRLAFPVLYTGNRLNSLPRPKPATVMPTPTMPSLEARAVYTPAPFIDPDGGVQNNDILTTTDGQPSQLTPCGYIEGDSRSPRAVPSGWDCRVDRQKFDKDTNIPYCWDVVLDVALESHTASSSYTRAIATTESGSNSASGNGASSGQDAQSNMNNAAPVGVIVGASLAALFVLCCTILLALWIVKRRGSKNTSKETSGLSQQRQQTPQQSPDLKPATNMEAKPMDNSPVPVEIGPGQRLDFTNCNELPAASVHAEMEAPRQNAYQRHNTASREHGPI